jgi:DNA-binding MarR family transcriptional regulator
VLLLPPSPADGPADAGDPDGGPDDRATAAMSALRAVIIEGERYRRAVADHFGVGLSEMLALGHLAASGPINPRQLAAELGLTPSTVTALVDRLAADDLVVRRPHPTDRRKTVISMTEGGNRILLDMRAWLGAAVGRLDQDRLPEVTELLEAVAHALSAQLDVTTRTAPTG